MNLFELFKPTKNLIMEGIDHPEDLIISQGSAGADRVLKDLASLEKDPSTVTVKWDGFPAVVFGRDKTGALVFMDKHMYEKVVAGKMEFMSIKDYDASRDANRSSLWEHESVLRPALEKIVPQVKDQYWMGDLMWTGTPKTNDGYFVFKPNTVEYRVKIDDTPGRGNTLSDQIARSVGGIAVHTFISGLGQPDQPLIGLKGLAEDAGVTFLVGEMKDKPRVALNPTMINQTKQTIDAHRSAVDKFISDLTAMKGKSVITAMGPFITRMLEEDDIRGDIVPRFLEFLKERLSGPAAAKMLGENKDGWLYQEDGGAPGLLGIWTMWAAITELKTTIKQQIDSQQQGSEIIAITDGTNAHEGYVFGAGKDKLKLVDRLGFSRANFSKHKVPDEEIAQKSKMPLAVFCFGRMNPPTKGHGLVLSKTLEAGGENAFIFLSNSVGPTDPLPPATKANFIEEIYPETAGHIVTDYVQGPIYAANWLYQKGFRNMAFVAGSDRLGKEKGSIEKLLTGWNSGPIRSTDPAGAREHVVMQYISAGDRDPESEGVTGYSGTKARAAAEAGNEQQFQQFTGVGPDVVVNGKTLYQATREGMGVKDQPAQPAAPVKKQPVAPSQKIIGKEPVEKKVPGKAPMKTKQADLVESVLRDKEDYYAKRKALQDIQLDPNTHKDPALKNELIKRKHELEREAKKMGIISEAIVRTLADLDEDTFGTSVKRPARPGSRPARNVKEGDVLQFPKKHKGDLDGFDECPKCGGDLQGGKYMGHKVKVCIPCSQVYLPPNTGIDQKGNKVDEIAGAFPSPSTREKWAKDAAASNAAEAKRLAAKAAVADAERLKTNTELVDKEQKVNHHSLDGEAVPPKNEARANTKTVRTGLAKREKRADPVMDAKKKSEQDAAWERLQAHMSKPENMAVLKRLATKESAGISADKETKFHAKLDKLVHDTFGKREDELEEAPIEMDPQNPNDPMVMPPGLNPGKLSYRKSRAASQLADLARMAAQANEKDSPAMWDAIVKHFPELETNIRSIQHGMQELEARRRKGGTASRGIQKQS